MGVLALNLESVQYIFSTMINMNQLRTRPNCRKEKLTSVNCHHVAMDGAAAGIRTPNLLIRSQMLYPIELRPQRSPIGKYKMGRWSNGKRINKNIFSEEGGLLI